jgi:sepiapterin reductase
VLKDAVILITGAGKGIGEAVVQDLLEKRAKFPGLKLFITSRTESELKSLCARAKTVGVTCEFLASDLADTPLAAFRACKAIYGRIDVFIHCAGVGRFGNFTELTNDDLHFVMKTNIEASFLLMQAVYAQMQKQMQKQPDHEFGLKGQIQWITSVAAEQPFEQSAIYCMSKYAQRGLIEVMRIYARKDRIRILEVKPGAVVTPMWGDVPKEQQQKMMDAKDIAGPMVDALLLGPKASLEVLTFRPVGGDL